MSEYDDKTAIGGENIQFPQTAWTMILDSSLREKMRQEISTRYWKPLYFYLRRKGYDNETAKELTQGFFAEILLGRDLIEHADQTKGKFRTLLLTALNRYVASIRRSKKGLLSEKVANLEIPGKIPDHIPYEPVDAFDYTWAAALLEGVLAELEVCCRRDGMEIHWRIFHAKVLEPITNDTVTPSWAEICAKNGINDHARASNMLVTVKRRFQVILRRQLRQTVESAVEVEGAFQDLLNIFSKN